MDRLFLSLHHRIEHMGRTGDLSGWAAPMSAARLRRIDTAKTPHALSVQYLRLRRMVVNEMRSSRDPAAAERLSATLADVETLVNLRQQARNFAELAVLTMLAAVACAMAVTARPAGIVVPFAGWAHDTASLVIAAVFAFLGFDLIDKRREAYAPLLRRVTQDAHKHHRQPPGWRLEMVAWGAGLDCGNPRIKDADTPLPLVGSMSDRVNIAQCHRAQVRIVIPPGGENRFRPLVDNHTRFRPPVSSYPPEQLPENARWKI